MYVKLTLKGQKYLEGLTVDEIENFSGGLNEFLLLLDDYPLRVDSMDTKQWLEHIENYYADELNSENPGITQKDIEFALTEQLVFVQAKMMYSIEELLEMFVEEGLLEDRREYGVEDLMLAYPGLTSEQAEELQKIIAEEKGERRGGIKLDKDIKHKLIWAGLILLASSWFWLEQIFGY